tara:strand:+ start:4561 stop:4809 length:249 start_codon:yes stop_codon:yes gene_type:complete
MDADFIHAYWDQLVTIFLAVAAIVKLKAETVGLRKDLDNLRDDLAKRDTYIEVVRLRAELDVAGKNVSALWNTVNQLRDRDK